MREIDKVLDADEKVFWEGKPVFWPFVFNRGIIISLFGLLMTVVMTFVLFSAGTFILLTPHFWLGPALLFGPITYALLVYDKVYYAITNKRVILQGGVIGRDFEMVEYDQITNAEVNVGFSDVIFGGKTGSIMLSTAGTFTYTRNGVMAKPYTICNVLNPYEVFKFFKKTSYDVKTDVNYPNKYRPGVNPGYKTQYKPPQVPTGYQSKYRPPSQ